MIPAFPTAQLGFFISVLMIGPFATLFVHEAQILGSLPAGKTDLDVALIKPPLILRVGVQIRGTTNPVIEL
jgi:hypothetical protein